MISLPQAFLTVGGQHRESVLGAIRNLLRYRELLYMLTWRDICIRYKQSILGILWAILMPTAIVLAGLVVRMAIARVSGTDVVKRDLALVSVKAVPWAFFIAAIRFSTTCLIGNSNLVTKIAFPKVMLPVSSVFAQFFDFLIAFVVLVILLGLLGVQLSVTLLWVPVLVVLLVTITAGLGIFLSAAALFLRDVKYLVEIFLTFAIFFTPILYEVSMFKGWEHWLLLNPLAPILESFADVMIKQTAPNLFWLGYSALAAMVILLMASLYFRRSEPRFAECI
jgi:lipopolysaccharide transport system permease protein